MEKQKLGKKNHLFPNPIVLVGANVNGRPNYVTVSYCGIANRIPAMLSISMNKLHYTRQGIKETGVFSINVPSADMVKITDYCGLVSGSTVDKAALFNTFYGVLGNAPMIKECPINIECKVVSEVELEGTNVMIIGEVIESYAENKYLTNNTPDIKKVDPILLSLYESNYYNVGHIIGKAWSVGATID